MDKKIIKLIEQYLAGELNPDQVMDLRAKLKDFKELEDIHFLLEKLKLEQPADNEFDEMRRNVLSRIELNNARRKHFSFLENFSLFLQELFYRPQVAWVTAALLFFIGLFGGMYFAGYNENKAFSDVNGHNPYIFRNAQFEEINDGKVKVNFEVSQNVTLKRSTNDPVIREILAQSILNSNNLGQRLRNVEDSKKFINPMVKEALIISMKNDANQAVRQKSQESLMSYPQDKEITKAMMDVLKNEESVLMRLSAIDYLAQNEHGLKELQNEVQNLDPKIYQAAFQKMKTLEVLK